MSNLRNDIPGFLGEKLSDASAPVDPSLWQNIADKLPAQAPASGGESVVSSSSPGLSVAAKIAVWSGAAVFTGAAGYAVFSLLSDESTPNEQTIEVAEPAAQPEPEVNYDDVVVSEPEHPAGQAVDPPKPNNNTDQRQATEQIAPANQPVETTTDRTSDDAQAAQKPAVNPTPPSVTPQTTAPSTQAAPAPAPAPQDPEPSIELSADYRVAFDANDELLASFTAEWQDGEQYYWSFGDGNTSSEVSPMHRFDEEGTYAVHLSVTDINGNEAALSADVEVRHTPMLVLPNIFTPNNDGLNDVLNISEDSKHVTVLRMIVFDQRGKVVFEQMGNESGWDGLLIDGSLAPEATYRFVVTAEGSDGKQYNESSFVRLQR